MSRMGERGKRGERYMLRRRGSWNVLLWISREWTRESGFYDVFTDLRNAMENAKEEKKGSACMAFVQIC